LTKYQRVPLHEPPYRRRILPSAVLIRRQFGIERQALVCEQVAAPAVARRRDALKFSIGVQRGDVIVDDGVVIHVDVAIAISVEAFAVTARPVVVAPAGTAAGPGCDVLGVHVAIVVEVEGVSRHVSLELPVGEYQYCSMTLPVRSVSPVTFQFAS
jgi:hypothetical protein